MKKIVKFATFLGVLFSCIGFISCDKPDEPVVDKPVINGGTDTPDIPNEPITALNAVPLKDEYYKISKYEVLNGSVDLNNDGISNSDLLLETANEYGFGPLYSDSDKDLQIRYFKNSAKDTKPNHVFFMSCAFIRQNVYFNVPHRGKNKFENFTRYGFSKIFENYTPYHFEANDIHQHEEPEAYEGELTPNFKIVSFKQAGEKNFQIIVEVDYFDYKTQGVKAYQCLVEYEYQKTNTY